MNHALRNLVVGLLVFLAAFLAPQAAEAQATLSVSGAAGTVTATGVTELIGEVTVTITSGTSVAGRLEIAYPVAFTNDASTGITVNGTGGLAGATFSVAASSGIIIVNVPPGGGVGNTITISGARYAPATNSATMTAGLSSTGNFITAGQGVVTVVTNTAVGFILDAIPSPAFSISNGVIVSGPANFVITEGYESSFTSTVGLLGQTVPTQIIFRVIGLPDNITLTFPATAVSGSGATLTAVTPVALTNQSVPSEVVYQFGASGSSQATIDQFTITPVIGVTGPAGTGTTFIQAALGPIGAAVPTTTLPSTAIPRFAENFLPPLSSLPGAILTLNFPTSQLAASQNISVSNLGSGGAALSFRANLSDGTVATSTQSPALVSHETRVFSIQQLFGTGASTSTVASVQVESLNSRLVGTSFDTAPGGRTAIAAASEVQQFILPFNLTPTREGSMSVINSGTAVATLSLRLRTASGQILATASVNVLNGTTYRAGLLSAFNLPAAAVPVDVYVEGTSTSAVQVSGFANPQGPVEEMAALVPAVVRSYRHPFFVSGGGYSSVLTLVNTSSFPIQALLTPLQGNGSLFPGVAPITQVVAPFQRADVDFARFFPNTASLRTGSLSMYVERADVPNPFSAPLVVGMMRTRISTASALVPLFTERVADSFFSPVIENNQAYTGIALLNDAAFDINVTVDVFSAAGTLLGSKTFLLPALSLQAQLIREIVPAAAGQDNELVHITTTVPIGLIGFRGTWSLNELLFLQPQR